MPLYDYRIDGTNEVFERYFRASELPAPQVLVSSTGRRAVRQIAKPARVPDKWGDSSQKRYYNRGLGCWVSGDREARAIAKRRGLVCHQELGTESEQRDIVERQLRHQRERSAAEQAELGEYAAAVQRHDGDRAAAVAEVWSAERVLSGATVFSTPS